MPALLGGRQLILEVHAACSGFDQGFGQFEGIEVAAETGLRIGNDGNDPVDVFFAVHVMDLIGAQEGVVDALHHFRHGIDRIETLVRIHFTGRIGVAGHLPAGAVNRLQSGLHGLNRLISGHAAETRNDGLGM